MTWAEQEAPATGTRTLGGPSRKGSGADAGLPPKTRRVRRAHCASAWGAGGRAGTRAGWGGPAGGAETDPRGARPSPGVLGLTTELLSCSPSHAGQRTHEWEWGEGQGVWFPRGPLTASQLRAEGLSHGRIGSRDPASATGVALLPGADGPSAVWPLRPPSRQPPDAGCSCPRQPPGASGRGPLLAPASHSLVPRTQGYLFISVLVNSNSELIRLINNAIRNDLAGRNPTFMGLALHCVANVGSREMAEAFAGEIPKILVAGYVSVTCWKVSLSC